MKLGLMISAGILVLFGVLLVFAMQGNPDPPTSATSAENLALRALPTDLPALFEPTQPDADAKGLYLRAFEQFDVARRSEVESRFSAQQVDELTRLLVEAMQAGRLERGWLDAHTPLQPGGRPEHEMALMGLPAMLIMRADERYREGEQAQATQAALALWALGWRCFEHNDRMLVRWHGVFAMRTAIEALQDWLPDEQAQTLSAYSRSLREIDRYWQPKAEMLQRLKMNVGDAVRMAQADADPTFRIEAMLKLGMLKFAAGSADNLRAIERTIQQGRSDADERIAQAAEAAEAFTIEQYRRLGTPQR